MCIRQLGSIIGRGNIEKMEWIKNGMIIAGLVWNSILDLREKRVSLLVTVLYGLLGIGYQILQKEIGFWMIASFLPGLSALALAKLTREKIGYGDGFMLLALGCYIRLEEMAWVCMIAVCLAGLFALILLAFFHKKRDYAIPFVPFLLLGYVMETYLCG